MTTRNRVLALVLIGCSGAASAQHCIPSGVVDQYTYFVAVDTTDLVARETGLTGFTVYRSRNGAAAAAFTTPTVNETDGTNMPGVYELLLDEDMTIDSGDDVQHMTLHITHTEMEPVTKEICIARPKITAGETLTVSAEGDANADVKEWLATDVATPTVGGVPEVDVTHQGGTAGTFSGGIADVNVASANAAALQVADFHADVILTPTEAETAAGNALTTYDPPTRTELTADKAEIMSMIGQRWTITVTDQNTIVLADGPAQDNAFNPWAVMLLDASDAGGTDLVRVAGWTGSSKTMELARNAAFTMVTGDVAVVLPAFLTTPSDAAFVNCTTNTAFFAGSTTTVACILTDKDGGAVTVASGDLVGLELRVLSGAQAYEGRFIESTTWDATNSELQLTLSRALPATLADGVTAIIR